MVHSLSSTADGELARDEGIAYIPRLPGMDLTCIFTNHCSMIKEGELWSQCKTYLG